MTSLPAEPLKQFDENLALAAMDAMDQLIITTLTARAMLAGEIQRSRKATRKPVLRLAEEQRVIEMYNASLDGRGTSLALLVLQHCRVRD